MAARRLTEEGKNFIRTIAAGNGNSLLSGSNRWTLKFSEVEGIPTIFTSQARDLEGQLITTNTQLGEYLIRVFDLYSEQYDLDANILAAQDYQESRFKIWNYAGSSSASGISQFIGVAFYDFVVENRGPEPDFSQEEIDKLTLNLEQPTQLSSYKYKGKNTTPESRARAKRNRLKLHQNIIDNPDLMIKAQAKLMRFISDRNNGLAANTLFAYNRGSGLAADNYIDIVKNTAARFGSEYIEEGVDYVEKIFGYLGDKNNTQISGLDKPVGVWFGFDEIDFSFDNFVANLG